MLSITYTLIKNTYFQNIIRKVPIQLYALMRL